MDFKLQLTAGKVGALALLAVLVACADARQDKPLLVSVSGNAKKIASCTFRSLKNDSRFDGADNRLTILDDVNGAEFTSDLPVCGLLGCTGSRRLFEVTFISESETTTQISVKEHPTFSGSRRGWPEVLQPKVAECSAKLAG